MNNENQENGQLERPICPTCSAKVIGRSDKIFCCVPCKNKHHSDVRVQFKSRFQNTISRIKRNWVVLEGIMGKEHNRMKIHKDALFEHGFDCSYFTSAHNKGKQMVIEIGEYQCIIFENGIVEVKRMTSLSKWMPGFFERWLVSFPEKLLVNGDTGEVTDREVNGAVCRFNENPLADKND